MKLPVFCPSCEQPLKVSQLKCGNCPTEVNGDYELPLYLNLSREEQDFIMAFSLPAEVLKKWPGRPIPATLPCATGWTI